MAAPADNGKARPKESVPKNSSIKPRPCSLVSRAKKNGWLDSDGGLLPEIVDPRREEFPTGIESVDETLSGGIHGLTMLAGRAGVGKTAFLAQVIANAVRKNDHSVVLVYSLDMVANDFCRRILISAQSDDSTDQMLSKEEMGRIWIKDKMTSTVVQQLSRDRKEEIWAKFRRVEHPLQHPRPTPEEDAERKRNKQKLHRFFQILDPSKEPEYEFNNLRFFNQEETVSSISETNISNDIESLKGEMQIQNVLVAIDLFQDISCAASGANQKDDEILRLIKSNHRLLKNQYSKGNVAFLIASAVRKGGNQQRFPNRGTQLVLDDLIGSTTLAYAADTVLALNFEEEVSHTENKVILDVLKSRGRIKRGPLPIRYIHDIGLFSDGAKGRSSVKKEGPNLRTPGKKKVKDLD